MIIDAHLHVWSQNTEKYPWNPIGGYIPEESATIDEFIQQMEEAFVEKAVVVQPTPYGWDNSYLLDVCRREKGRLKAIVLVNPESAEAGGDLRKLIDEGADGLRLNLHLLPAEFIATDIFHALIDTAEGTGIPVCFQLTPEYFDGLEGIFRQYPQTRFILDHMARPRAGSKPDDPAFTRLLNLSEYANAYVKLSGLNYFSNQSNPYEDTWPLLKATCDRFSAKRCMWGSDFPFVNDHWLYTDLIETFQKNIGFSEDELIWIMSKTAESIWWKR